MKDIEETPGYFGSPELFSVLLGDVDYAFSELEKDKESQYLRRNVVRVTFGFIEGICSVLLNEVWLKHMRDDVDLSGREIKVVEGEETELIQRIKKAFSSYAKLHSIVFSLNTSAEEFKHLNNAKKIRNRLAHPKRYVHILISDEDMSSIAKVHIWMKSEFVRIINTMINERFKKIPESIRDNFRTILHEKI